MCLMMGRNKVILNLKSSMVRVTHSVVNWLIVWGLQTSKRRQSLCLWTLSRLVDRPKNTRSWRPLSQVFNLELSLSMEKPCRECRTMEEEGLFPRDLKVIWELCFKLRYLSNLWMHKTNKSGNFWRESLPRSRTLSTGWCERMMTKLSRLSWPPARWLILGERLKWCRVRMLFFESKWPTRRHPNSRILWRRR